MTPLMLAGASPLPDTRAPANDSVLSANADLYSGELLPERFDQLMQNSINSSDGAIAQIELDQAERLEMIRTTVEEMDDSEVVGFLAMLENQAGWNLQEQGALKPLSFGVSESVAKEPLQRQMADFQLTMMGIYGEESINTEAVKPANTLSAAVQEAMNKATENYVPAVREQADSESNLLLSSLTDRSSLTGNQVDANSLDLNAAILKQGVQSSTLTIDSPQSGFELNLQDGSRIAPGSAQAKGDFSQLTQTTSEYLSDARPLPNAREAGWSEALGQRLVMMVGEQRQEAQLRLDPPDLGSLGIKLVVEERGVSIQFNSAIPQVRDMLEAQVDRLRAAMSSQGLDLVDVNVGDDARSQEQSQPQSGDQSASLGGLTAFSEDEALDGQWVDAEIRVPVNQSLINTFA